MHVYVLVCGQLTRIPRATMARASMVNVELELVSTHRLAAWVTAIVERGEGWLFGGE